MAYATKHLTTDTRDDFASLVQAPEAPYEQFGFVRDRRIAKWRWVMRVDVPAA
ncbi:hypothetical protein ACH436_14985 [Isoptericola sp. NPDC019693]|uniref:hypothetical protein n=1 Tax=Isoptericola sp. NPDC019693 TaxID=3364009 RepID=UPI00379C8F64